MGGIIFDSQIKRSGMCKEEKENQCTSFCRKFLRSECAGMRYIRTADDRWIDQEEYPFPMYKEENKK